MRSYGHTDIVESLRLSSFPLMFTGSCCWMWMTSGTMKCGKLRASSLRTRILRRPDLCGIDEGRETLFSAGVVLDADYAILHAGDPVEHTLHLLDRNPIPANLHLIVDAANELVDVFRYLTDQIAGLVQAPAWAEWVIDKGRAGLLRRVEIP